MLIKQFTLLILALFSITNEINSAQPSLPVGNPQTLYEIWCQEAPNSDDRGTIGLISCNPQTKNPLPLINQKMTTYIKEISDKIINTSFSAPALLKGSDCTNILQLAVMLINLPCVETLLKKKQADPNIPVFTSNGRVQQFMDNHYTQNQKQTREWRRHEWSLRWTQGQQNRRNLASCFQPTTIMNEYIRAGKQLTGYNQEWVEIGKLLLEHGAKCTDENIQSIKNIYEQKRQILNQRSSKIPDNISPETWLDELQQLPELNRLQEQCELNELRALYEACYRSQISATLQQFLQGSPIYQQQHQ